MCMQTQFGCCIIDGEVVEKKSGKSKMKNEKLKLKDKNNKKQKKVIHQSEVEFE